MKLFFRKVENLQLVPSTNQQFGQMIKETDVYFRNVSKLFLTEIIGIHT